MAQPIVFISRHRIRKGSLEELREMFTANVPVMRSEKPGTVVFYAFTNEAGTEVKFVHLFPDAAAMDAHLEGAAERSERAMEYLEPQSFEILGRPSDDALAMMDQAAQGGGAELVLYPETMGGYLRLEG